MRIYLERAALNDFRGQTGHDDAHCRFQCQILTTKITKSVGDCLNFQNLSESSIKHKLSLKINFNAVLLLITQPEKNKKLNSCYSYC